MTLPLWIGSQDLRQQRGISECSASRKSDYRQTPRCVIIDLFSRKVIAHKISRENNTELVLETFKLAYERRGKPQGLLFHSDQGTQYSAYKFRKYLRDLGVKQSFSNPGTPYDNAVAESFFSMMKQEELSHNYYHSEDELNATVAEYINFFNTMRPHRKLGGLTSDEFEKRYFSRQQSEGQVSKA